MRLHPRICSETSKNTVCPDSIKHNRKGRAVAKSPAEENSERKRVSIPKADESVLAWWEAQKDPGLSIRLLIRNEIERSGYSDTAFRPVMQLPRRGRPANLGSDTFTDVGPAELPTEPTVLQTGDSRHAAQTPTPAVHMATAGVSPQSTPQLVGAGPAAGSSFIDDLMNG